MNEHMNSQQHDGEMVRVAINSYQRALFLKSILESEGIPAMVTSVNIIQPNAEGCMQVLINENDLQRASDILSKVDLSYSDLPENEDASKSEINEIVVPTDFSNHSMKACEFAFHLAEDLGCSIKLLHTFFMPYYPAAMPFNNPYMMNAPDDDLYREIHDKVEKQMKTFVDAIQAKISSGALPNVKYSYLTNEGLPEEEIVVYSKKYRPKAIVMGTRGKNNRDLDIIGSVTAEVIENSKSSVFAIPEASRFQQLRGMKTLGFLTNFNENEFKAFDILMRFISQYDIKVHLIHVAKGDDKWDEMKLSGVQKFLKEKYPSVETSYSLIDSNNEKLEVVIDEFVTRYQIDILAMSKSRRNLLARVFNPGLAHRIVFHASTPLLVLQRS